MQLLLERLERLERPFWSWQKMETQSASCANSRSTSLAPTRQCWAISPKFKRRCFLGFLGQSWCIWCIEACPYPVPALAVLKASSIKDRAHIFRLPEASKCLIHKGSGSPMLFEQKFWKGTAITVSFNPVMSSNQWTKTAQKRSRSYWPET